MTVTILFVDHADHRKTGSSDFFRQLLQNNFDVQYRLFDPNINVDVESLANLVASDVIVVLWQVDYLAPIFLSLGLRTIVIPMYDASEHAPDLHWIWSQHASFINFSRSLHDRLRRLGLDSLWVKYFPKPQGKEHRAKFDALRAFLWQRRPEQGINLHTVEKILGDGVKAIHVHDVPDSALTNTTKYLFPTIKSYDLTISSWFENSSKYYEVLEQANVFFAPRRTEGIGLAMLEAMSRGMTIFASELPTHDEYIANWVNGVLYSSLAEFRRAEIDLGQAQALGSLALETVADGYIRWVRQEPLIFDFIQSAPRPNKLPLESVSLFGTGLLHAYRSGGHTYRNYLIANEVLIRETSGFPGTGRFTAEGNYQSTPIVEAPHQVTAALNVPWLESLEINMSDIGSKKFLLTGQLKILKGVPFIVGQSVLLGFRLDPHLGMTNTLRIKFVVPENLRGSLSLCVLLNDIALWMQPPPPDQDWLELDIPSRLMGFTNLLRLQTNTTTLLEESDVEVSLGVEVVQFL